MTIFPSDLPATLGFDFIVRKLEEFCIGKKAKAQIKKIYPSTNLHFIMQSLDEIREYLIANASQNSSTVAPYPEIENEIQILKIQNSVLDTKQIVKIRKLIILFNELVQFYYDK